MDANESRTQTPNLAGKVAELEKQNRLLLRRLAALEKAHKQLELAHRMMRTHISQVEAKKSS